MIYDIPGDEFIYEGVTYRVGAEVVATQREALPILQ